ncbi:MAG: hypothetical protein ACRD2C_18560 [Acidimicrobiales bacterium]
MARRRKRVPLAVDSLPSMPWDPDLREAMTNAGIAVYEEEVRRRQPEAMQVQEVSAMAGGSLMASRPPLLRQGDW